MVLDRTNFELSVPSDGARRILWTLQLSALIGVVKDQTSQEMAVSALREVKGVLREIEDRRTELKSPVWELGKQIDAKAKQISSDLSGESARLTQLIDAFQREQREQREAVERERQAELQRIESERLEKISEANRILQQQADERAAELRAIEQASLKASEIERADLERKRQIIERERRVQEFEAATNLEAEAKARAASQAYLDSMRAPVPVVAEGMKVKPSYDFEVVNMHDFYRAHPGNVKMEVRRTETLDLINRLGMRTVPGLRVFEKFKIDVRPASAQKVIEV